MTDIDELVATTRDYAGVDEYGGAVLLRELADALEAEHKRSLRFAEAMYSQDREAYERRDKALSERDAALAVIEQIKPLLGGPFTASDGYTSVATADGTAIREVLNTISTDVLSERDAEKWDEGAEAYAEWPQHTNGIPNDPPANPYRQKREEIGQ